MSVRAKFTVTKIESTVQMHRNGTDEQGRDHYDRVEMRTVVLSPVYGNGDPAHENTRFWQATPSGEIRLGVVNPEAWQHFELDKEYYIDFTPANG